MPPNKTPADPISDEVDGPEYETVGATILSAHARAEMHSSVARLKRALREAFQERADRDRRGPRERG